MKSVTVFFIIFLVGTSKTFSSPGPLIHFSSQAKNEKYQQVFTELHVFAKICQALPVEKEVLLTDLKQLEKLIAPHVLHENQEKEKEQEGKGSFELKKFRFAGFFFPYTAPHKKFILSPAIIDAILKMKEVKENTPFQNCIMNTMFWRRLHEKGMKFQFRIGSDFSSQKIKRAVDFFPKGSLQLTFQGGLEIRSVFPIGPYMMQDKNESIKSVQFVFPKHLFFISDVLFSGHTINAAVIAFLRQQNPKIHSLKFEDCFMIQPFSLEGFEDLRVLHLGFCRNRYLQDFHRILPKQAMTKLYDLKIESSDQLSEDDYIPHARVLIGSEKSLQKKQNFLLEKLEISIPPDAHDLSLVLCELPHLKSLKVFRFDHKMLKMNQETCRSDSLKETSRKNIFCYASFPLLETLHLGRGICLGDLPAGAVDFEKIRDLYFYESLKYDYFYPKGKLEKMQQNLPCFPHFPHLRTLACSLTSDQKMMDSSDPICDLSSQILQHPKIENLTILNVLKKPAWPEESNLPSLKTVDFRLPQITSYKGVYYAYSRYRFYWSREEHDYPKNWLVDTKFLFSLLKSQKQPVLTILCDLDLSSDFKKEIQKYSDNQGQKMGQHLNLENLGFCWKITSQKKNAEITIN
jgi:hypothetical protein